MKKMDTRKLKVQNKVELLAPAGSFGALVAAVQNGADAVYLGGSSFNARMNAQNFSDEELRRAVSYAHLRSAKVFVTFNTLIFDEEMEEALRYAAFLYSIGVDALIIQDLGLGAEIRKLFPDFELHLSTQATIASRRGVEAAARLGYSRVVLARELSIDDIRACCSADVCSPSVRSASVIPTGVEGSPYSISAPEIEVFVHGALCFCYSGQCQFSRARGGRSGNRGACAQPCRLPYSLMPLDSSLAAAGDRQTSASSGVKLKTAIPSSRLKTESTGGKPKTVGANDKVKPATPTGAEGSLQKHILSPKDLCLLPYLPELIEAGAASFKIEGRMKSAEYVAIVTAVYRKYIDLYFRLRDEGRASEYAVEPEDMEKLMLAFNRGGFTTGYLFGNPGDELLSGDIPKHQGVKVGVVTALPGRGIVGVKLDSGAKLEMGDGFEIHTKDGVRPLPGNIATYLAPSDKTKTVIPRGRLKTESTGGRLKTVGTNDKTKTVIPGGGSEATGVEGSKYILIGDIRKGYERIQAGDAVYKTSSRALLEEARRSYFAGEKDGEKIYAENRKTKIRARFEARIGEPAVLTIESGTGTASPERGGGPRSGTEVIVRSQSLCTPALKKPLTAERAAEQLSKLGGTPFELAEPECKIDEGLSLPISEINAMRREAAELLAAEYEKGRIEIPRFAGEGHGNCDREAAPGHTMRSLPFEPPLKGEVPLKGAEGFTLAIPAVTKGAMDARLEAEFAEDGLRRYEGKPVLAESLAWVEPLIAAGAKVYIGPGLNATNSAAAKLFTDAGAAAVLASHELMDPLPKGAPLMISEHLFEGVLKDEKGRRYLAKISEAGDKTVLTEL